MRILPERSGRFSAIVGRTFSFTESETKKAKGTSHRQIVKYANTWKKFHIID